MYNVLSITHFNFAVIILENNTLLSDQKEVYNVLNEFYANTAKEIGINSQTSVGENHIWKKGDNKKDWNLCIVVSLLRS